MTMMILTMAVMVMVVMVMMMTMKTTETAETVSFGGIYCVPKRRSDTPVRVIVLGLVSTLTSTFPFSLLGRGSPISFEHLMTTFPVPVLQILDIDKPCAICNVKIVCQLKNVTADIKKCKIKTTTNKQNKKQRPPKTHARTVKLIAKQ